MRTTGLLLAAAFATLALGAGAAAEVSTYTPPAIRAATLDYLRAHVNTVRAHKCLAPLPIRQTGAQVPTGLRPWVLALWVRRHLAAHRAREQCSAQWAWRNGSFHSALRLAAATFGVSYGWLHACDHSEGSDRFVYNHYGSGAFGPMQFLGGTFYANVGAAFAAARARGVAVPGRYARWDSNLGQALTAAYMFSRGWSGQWTGAGC